MAESTPLLLGLDIGSSRTKALLLEPGGRPVGSAAVATPFEASGEHTEATLEGIVGALGRAMDELGEARRSIAGIGIAGIAESGVPLDASGEAIGPIVAWHDRRGEDVADRLSARFGPDLSRCIGQELRYVSTVAKLGWLLEHGLAPPARWLGVPELCLHALTGTEATEYSLAARTGCWDVGQRSWLPEVARAGGFDVGVFPAVRPAGEPMGEVTPEAAHRFGLPAGVPVTIAGHDHLAGVVGTGADPEDLANSVGTAETVVGRCRTLPDVGRALDLGVAVTVFPGDGGWAVLASAARAGLAVEEAAASLGRPPAELDELARRSPLLDAPDLDRSLRDRETPALPDGPPGAVWRTLLEALAASTAEAVAKLTDLVEPPPRLVVFGGGARSEPWLAAKARHTGLPVWRAVSADAVARGAAVYGGVAAGWWEDPASAPGHDLERCGPEA